MKTLKKTLCLVLAVVMVVGVLVLPANAATTTAADADAEAAFKTLNGYGVMYGVDANNKPALDKNINRQDMAAIVYRIMTGDTKDKYVGNYVGSAEKFADSATFATWAKGYIGYVRNNGIFMGDEKGNFKPTDNITGDEVLTVLLRCIGYGQNGEFTGASWAENAEAQATRIHLFGNATGYLDVKANMSKVINRGIVAKLTSNAVKAPMVTYFNGEPSIYQDNQGRPVAPNTPDAKPNPALISTGDNSADVEVEYDEWGTPSKDVEHYVYFNYPQTKVTSTKKIPLEPMTTFWTAKSHCDLSTELKVEKAIEKIAVYTNGYENKTTLAKLDPLNTTAQIGAQGRYTAVYDTNNDKKPDVIVYKDTLLAMVTDVKAATYDKAGHPDDPATLELKVFDGPANTGGGSTDPVDTADTDTQGVSVVTLENGTTNWSYTKGQFILLFYHQKSTTDTDVQAKTTADYKKDYNKDDTADWHDYYTIQSVATSISGAQTVISTNGSAHTISGTKKPDNNRYVLDEAGDDTKATYTWFLDSKGNVIGSVKEKVAHNYGVITSLYWEDAKGDGYAEATVVYMDGTTDTVKLHDVTPAAGRNSYTVGTTMNNTHYGVAVVDGAANAMTTDDTNDKFYVSESKETNQTADDKNTGYGILLDNLFEITKRADGTYSFVEVAGNKASNADPYVGLANAKTTVSKGVVTNDSGDGDALLINDNTKFLVRSTVSGKWVFTPVTGYKNIVNYDEGEVDFVDVDGDTYADYVYIIASPAAESGWHIFFADAKTEANKENDYAEMRYDHNVAAKTYTVYGYLDGVEGSVTIADSGNIQADFVNKMNGNTLWLVKIVGGMVTDVDGEGSNHSTNGAGDNIAINGSYDHDDVAGTPTDNTQKSAYTSGVALNNAANGMSATEDLGIYTGQSIILKTTDGDDTLKGTVLTLDGATYTVNDDTLVVGSWSLLSKTGNTVILVYGAGNQVKQAYVFGENDGTKYDEPEAAAKAPATKVTFNSITQELPTAYKTVKDALDDPIKVSRKSFNAAEGEVAITVTAASGTVSAVLIESYATKAAASKAAVVSGSSFSATNVHLAVGGYVVIGATIDSNTSYIAYQIVE